MPSTLSLNEIRARLARFIDEHRGDSDEDAQAKTFWDDLFTCYGTNRRQVARFEYPVRKLDGNLGFVDVLWKGKVIVEHKSRGRSLVDAKKQAEDYIERLKPSERPRYLVTCDFSHFELFDLHNGHEDKFTLEDLVGKAELLAFIGGYEPKRPSQDAPVNIAAVEKLGVLYDSMKDGGYPDHELQSFLVRILFCLFAEDTGAFEQDSFAEIIKERTSEDGSDLGIKLAQIFETLDSPGGKRQKALDEALAGLPYVNGQLFSGRLTLAATTSVQRAALIKCCDFDWSKISPAIFGSLFQGVMEPAERRALGAHYTSEENILKVIKPLFLDELRAEFAAIKSGPERGREQKLQAFHVKLSGLRFFDPACGCGNFLIITYRELRNLETEVLKALHPIEQRDGQLITDVSLLSKVSVDQFYGIEIEEFPSQIARVAMWLMDHVANVELGYAFGRSFTRLPLVRAANIVHGNALRIDWRNVVQPESCSYLLGNPPFIGHQWRTAEQKQDMEYVWGDHGRYGRLDFVTAWYRKAADFIVPTVRCAFVSTNSISQGEQVGILWGELFKRGIKIHFAHRTFVWESEARGAAHVHCVIIGFGLENPSEKLLYDYDHDPKGNSPIISKCSNISPYLIAGPDLVLPSRTEQPQGMPHMTKGSQPTDGGFLILSDDERLDLVTREPIAQQWVRPYMGGEDFINGKTRWCLWLKDVSPSDLRKSSVVMKRIEGVRSSRLESPTKSVRDMANSPTVFTQDRQPNERYLVVPEVSSEARRYIPMGFLAPEVIASNKLQMLPGASLFHFGVMCSVMHMAWLKVVGGRLKSDYSYAPAVYNNYPWPKVSPEQVAAVEHAAQAVLDARALFLAPNGDSTLADLYDPVAMPPELSRAHAALDRAVERCYRKEAFSSDRERVELLFALYEKHASPLAVVGKQPRGRK